MRLVRLVVLLQIAVSFALVRSEEDGKLSPKTCEELGFTGLALCSDCNTLAEYVKDDALVSECRRCCTEDSDDSMSKFLVYLVQNTKAYLEDVGFKGIVELLGSNFKGNVELYQVTYSGAILEVCMRKLVFYPEIVSFIEEDKDQFPYVKVQYAYASPPKLIMLNQDGETKETVRIDNWKREHVQQFLREKVKPSTESS